VRAQRLEQLGTAVAACERAPRDADATIWLGRRLAYLGRFREAIEVYTRGIREHPDDARFLRHRGHRWITLREFGRAVADLERAALLAAGRPDEIEPDGLPNAAGVPLETLSTNVWYHLGLAHYLLGHFESARFAFERCQSLAPNDDNYCSATHWLYMSLRRLGRTADAQRAVARVHAGMAVREYRSYHRLCLAYRGELDMDALYREAALAGRDSVEFATVGYGAGNWNLVNGEVERARELFREVVAGSMWPAFGHVAAEVELARLR
jgi:hypothetical protein